MYYNSNSDDYYNSYKKELAELEAYRKEKGIHKILKIILSFLLFTLLVLATVYLYKYFNPSLNNQQTEQILSKNKELPKLIIREEDLPQSIQLRESSLKIEENIQLNATDTTKIVKEEPRLKKGTELLSNMDEQEIALVVQLIMSKMNIQKEIPLEEQLEHVANKTFKSKSLKDNTIAKINK